MAMAEHSERVGGFESERRAVAAGQAVEAIGTVRKFGGTSVGGGKRLAEVARLVEELGARGSLVVVSAMAGATDTLVELGEQARRGAIDTAQHLAARLAQLHHRALVELGLGSDAALREHLEASLQRWREIANGAALLGDLSPKSADELLATGEILSSRLLAAALAARGVDAVWVDPRRVLVTDARFGRAEPDPAAIREEMPALVLPPLRAGVAVV